MLLMKIWTIQLGRSFHVTVSPYHLHPSPGSSPESSRNVVQKFGRFRWTSVGRLILKRERRSPSFRLQARRNIVVNFRDPDPSDVIITELNPNVGAARLPPTYEV